ncbi:very short patch repair endonuclease [Methylomonas sp. CM2]|uniref:very short patch repair endonuclease n=1 Tax=Methylomonas sp. CM2 TaxID=3417647 RepID=UPI003CF9E198
MSDTLSKEDRVKCMKSVRSKDTKPEIIVRRLVFGLGYRYRLHRKDLPGCPDLVFPRYKKVIFVHGCFWHVHEGCKHAKTPTSNVDYWSFKLERNKSRDALNQAALLAAGWRFMIVWECEVKSIDLAEKVKNFLSL